MNKVKTVLQAGAILCLCLWVHSSCSDTFSSTLTGEDARLDALCGKTWGYYKYDREGEDYAYAEEFRLHTDGTSQRWRIWRNGTDRDTVYTEPQWAFYDRELTVFFFTNSLWFYQIRSLTDDELRVSIFEEGEPSEDCVYRRKE